MKTKIIILLIFFLIAIISIILYYYTILEIMTVSLNLIAAYLSYRLTLLYYRVVNNLLNEKKETENIWNFLEEIGMDAEELRKAKEIYYND